MQNSFIQNNWDTLTALKYQLYSNEPLYSPDGMGRHQFYGGYYIPRANMDGAPEFTPTSLGALNSAYAGAMTQPCYVELFLAGTAQPNLMTGELNVTIIVEQDLGLSPYYLHVAACSYHVPYGAGYFSEFHYPARKMYPNYNGILVNVAGPYPETLQVDVPFTFSSSWWHFDSTDVYFAVWFQSHAGSNKQVHQSENMDISSLNAVWETPTPITLSDIFALGILILILFQR